MRQSNAAANPAAERGDRNGDPINPRAKERWVVVNCPETFLEVGFHDHGRAIAFARRMAGEDRTMVRILHYTRGVGPLNICGWPWVCCREEAAPAARRPRGAR